MPFVTAKYEAIVYDGTNGQYIATQWLDSATLVTDDGQTLVLEIAGWPPSQFQIPLGHYVLRYYGKSFYQPVSPEDYAQNWVEIPGGA